MAAAVQEAERMNKCAVCGNPPVLRRKRIGKRGDPTTGGRGFAVLLCEACFKTEMNRRDVDFQAFFSMKLDEKRHLAPLAGILEVGN